MLSTVISIIAIPPRLTALKIVPYRNGTVNILKLISHFP
jgi:hypothetical protein